MSGQTALLIGATGATGRHVLRELLKDPQFTRVGEFGRRSLPESELHGVDTSKLQRKVVDFEKLDEKEWKEGRWDIVYITLGTTRNQAGSAEAFEKIDREYVINAAKAAKSTDPSHHQRLVYLSSGGANASSSFLYTRSKGLPSAVWPRWVIVTLLPFNQEFWRVLNVVNLAWLKLLLAG